jgi:signal transduction histidine kinase
VGQTLKAETSHAARMARLEAEVEGLREELRRAQRLATVGTMTAMVAHEFNNILTPIINYAQLARDNPKMVPKAIARASEGGLRATEICKAILGLTREQPTEPREECLLELIRATLSAMARDPKRDAIDLKVDVSQDMTLKTRRAEMQQVLMNLLLNARRAVLARPAPRRIEIGASRVGDSVTIRIEDNGVGIPPENLERIFQPFFTTNGHENAISPGHGLGLTLCREIVESMNGRIGVTSQPGQGAAFCIHLPA